jgi:ABC-type proline/glycine betaine transport system substrate-binding protein
VEQCSKEKKDTSSDKKKENLYGGVYTYHVSTYLVEGRGMSQQFNSWSQEGDGRMLRRATDFANLKREQGVFYMGETWSS